VDLWEFQASNHPGPLLLPVPDPAVPGKCGLSGSIGFSYGLADECLRAEVGHTDARWVLAFGDRGATHRRALGNALSPQPSTATSPSTSCGPTIWRSLNSS
jgi:hypothetical protein